MMKKTDELVGIVHVYSSFNNTLVNLTDMAGNTIGRVSGGQITKHDRMKANPTIAMFIAKKIEEICKDYKINTLYIKMRGKTGATGLGPGANSLIKTLTKEGFRVLSISDVTKIARGGPKKKGGRRGRRV